MAESIGKCECLFEFDKHYIEKALDSLIEKTEAEFQAMQEEIKKDPENIMARMASNIMPDINILIHHFKLVKERVTATKTCD